MTDIPSIEPEKFTAGDTVEWTKTIGDYPAGDGWTLSYVLATDGNQITFDASAAGDDYAVTLAASTTSNYAAGTYRWQSYVISGSTRKTIEYGTIEILPNLYTQSTGYDTRTTAKQILDAIDAALLKRATKDQNSMVIAGERVDNIPVHRLLQLRNFYAAQVKADDTAEGIAKGLGHDGNILVRFV